MGFLTGKRALIVGIASERSIATGIAEAMHREGAELAFTYQNDKLKSRVEEVATRTHSSLVLPLDVAFDDSIESAFSLLSSHWKHFDILVHSVAYAPADQLDGDYIEVLNREGFRQAHDISSYSFGALAKASYPFMKDREGAMLTLSYLGAIRAIPNYNVMGVAKASLEANVRYLAASLGPKGIRVNAISAGPVRTLAASGIKDFRKMLAKNAQVVPLRRNIETIDVGNTAAFLCSDLARGITGEILNVDSGYHMCGMTELSE